MHTLGFYNRHNVLPHFDERNWLIFETWNNFFGKYPPAWIQLKFAECLFFKYLIISWKTSRYPGVEHSCFLVKYNACREPSCEYAGELLESMHADYKISHRVGKIGIGVWALRFNILISLHLRSTHMIFITTSAISSSILNSAMSSRTNENIEINYLSQTICNATFWMHLRFDTCSVKVCMLNIDLHLSIISFLMFFLLHKTYL